MTSPKICYVDTVGSGSRPVGRLLSELELPGALVAALVAYFGKDLALTPPQADALANGVVSGDAHFLVSALTNSGKTLIALLRLFSRSISSGGRFIYVAPLKVLAEEKVQELRKISELLKSFGGREVLVDISTGDYRISEDLPDSPPNEKAEILVCTPERLDVLLRNPEYHSWAASVDTFVFDEFHLLGQAGRGARFESLVTRIVLTCPQSVLLALSATFGSVERSDSMAFSGGAAGSVHPK